MGVAPMVYWTACRDLRERVPLKVDVIVAVALAGASREANASALDDEDLSKVSGGQTCTGTHYASVSLGLRKSAGNSRAGSEF